MFIDYLVSFFRILELRGYIGFSFKGRVNVERRERIFGFIVIVSRFSMKCYLLWILKI